MPLPSFITLDDTFGVWVQATNNLISLVDNTSVYLLVAQNATPRISTGNVSLNGTMTLVTVNATGTVTANIFSGNGVSLTSLNASALTSGTLPLARLTSANTMANGVVDTTTQSFAGDKTFTGTVLASGGAKIVVQNGTDGTSTRGIFLWTETDANWGLYLSQAGASKSLANGTAASSIDSRSGWHVRSRSGSLSSEGFLWENQAETALMNLTGDAGNLYVRGNVYVGATTTQVVLHTGSSTGINASALSTGTVPLARLDANVILTTSSTGINASALSTGTVPVARLSSANTTANGVVDTTTQSFAGAKTFVAAAAFSNTMTVTGTAIMNGTLEANNQLKLNTTNGRLILPVGANKYAT